MNGGPAGRVSVTSGRTIGRIGSKAVEGSSGLTVLRFSGPADYARLGAYVFFFNRVLNR